MQSHRRKQILRTLFQISLITMGALITNGCAVAIHDEPLYGDMGSNGAIEAHFLSSGTKEISKQSWDSLRLGMVCMPQSSFGDFKKEIEELCSRASCSYEVKQAMKVFFSKIESLRQYSERN